MTPKDRNAVDWGADSVMRPLDPLARALAAASSEDVALLMVALGRKARADAAPAADNSHGYSSKRFPLTAAQGRVLYHAERIFRSAGGPGDRAAARWRLLCQHAGLPELVSEWTRAQCIIGMQLIERAARAERMHLFRDTSTQWEDFQ